VLESHHRLQRMMLILEPVRKVNLHHVDRLRQHEARAKGLETREKLMELGSGREMVMG
jgi:hypothetical protein